jgi:hypothetical protein
MEEEEEEGEAAAAAAIARRSCKKKRCLRALKEDEEEDDATSRPYLPRHARIRHVTVSATSCPCAFHSCRPHVRILPIADHNHAHRTFGHVDGWSA